ncbi:MAG: hypothetical protein MHM6MM_003815 [Cercozoa sp. M6MM]
MQRLGELIAQATSPGLPDDVKSVTSSSSSLFSTQERQEHAQGLPLHRLAMSLAEEISGDPVLRTLRDSEESRKFVFERVVELLQRHVSTERDSVLQRCRTRLQRRDAEIRSMQEQLHRNEALQRQHEEALTARRQLASQNSTLMERVRQLEHELRSARQETETRVRAALSQAESHVTQLQRQVQQASQEKTLWQSRFAEFQQRLDALLSSEQTRRQQHAKEVRAKVETLVDAIQRERTASTAHRRRAESLAAKLDALHRRSTETTSYAKRMEQERDDLARELSSLKQRLSDTEAMLASTKDQIRAQQQQFATQCEQERQRELQQRRSEREADRRAHEAELNAVARENEQLRAQLQAAREGMQEARAMWQQERVETADHLRQVQADLQDTSSKLENERRLVQQAKEQHQCDVTALNDSMLQAQQHAQNKIARLREKQRAELVQAKAECAKRMQETRQRTLAKCGVFQQRQLTKLRAELTQLRQCVRTLLSRHSAALSQWLRARLSHVQTRAAKEASLAAELRLRNDDVARLRRERDRAVSQAKTAAASASRRASRLRQLQQRVVEHVDAMARSSRCRHAASQRVLAAVLAVFSVSLGEKQQAALCQCAVRMPDEENGAAATTKAKKIDESCDENCSEKSSEKPPPVLPVPVPFDDENFDRALRSLERRLFATRDDCLARRRESALLQQRLEAASEESAHLRQRCAQLEAQLDETVQQSLLQHEIGKVEVVKPYKEEIAELKRVLSENQTAHESAMRQLRHRLHAHRVRQATAFDSSNFDELSPAASPSPDLLRELRAAGSGVDE